MRGWAEIDKGARYLEFPYLEYCYTKRRFRR